MNDQDLNECLNDTAMIRSSLEVAAEFRDDATLALEIKGMVNRSRNSLVERLLGLGERICAGEGFEGADLREWQRMVIRLSENGHDGRFLESMMKTDVFSPDPDSLGLTGQYRFDLIPEGYRDQASSLAPAEFAGMIFDRRALAAEKAAHYESTEAFVRCVSRHIHAVLFAFYMCTDPVFCGR